MFYGDGGLQVLLLLLTGLKKKRMSEDKTDCGWEDRSEAPSISFFLIVFAPCFKKELTPPTPV